MRILWQGVRTQVVFGGGTRIPAEIIAAAKLPEPVATAIGVIVEQTKLRRAERCDVAAELCSHFAVGLSEGGTAEQLLADFGEPRMAAKLISRAVRRKRGWLYHTRRRAVQAAGAVLVVLLVFYSVLFLRFHLNKPNIARNYLAEYNARIAAMPKAETAWPIYRSLLPGWSQIAIKEHESLGRFPLLTPKDEGWPIAIEHLRRNADALVTIRRAAQLPGLGMSLSASDDPVCAAFINSASGLATTEAMPAGREDFAAPENPALINVLLPGAGILRTISRTLAFDARAAAEAGDGQRFVDDVVAIIGIGRQVREPRVIVLDLVGQAITSLGLSVIGEQLADRPELFTEAQLAFLSHTLAGQSGDGNPYAVRFDFERKWFDDAMQRLFSDNGSGDGILVADGFKLFESLQMGTDHPQESTLATTFAGPAAAGVMAGRREMTERYHSMIDQMERVIRQPLWERDDKRLDAMLEETSALARLRYMPIFIMMPALQRASIVGERTLQLRDAILTAIALELHRRRAGEYPASLSELTPKLLPTPPLDRFTGQPIRYVLKNGKPVLYSIGVDRTDGGGVPPPGTSGNLAAGEWMSAERAAQRVSELNAAARGILNSVDIRGDWVLWPEPKAEANTDK